MDDTTKAAKTATMQDPLRQFTAWMNQEAGLLDALANAATPGTPAQSGNAGAAAATRFWATELATVLDEQDGGRA